MNKVSSIFVFACTLLATQTALAQPTASEVVKRLNSYRTLLIHDAARVGIAPNAIEIEEKVRQRAIEILKRVSFEKIEAKDSFGWAGVFDKAGKQKEAIELYNRFLAADLPQSRKETAERNLLQLYRELGDGKMLVKTIRAIKPADPKAGQRLARSVALTFIDTVVDKCGVDEAVSLLDEVAAKVPATDHKAEATFALTHRKSIEEKKPPSRAPKPDSERLAEYERFSVERTSIESYYVV
jgi:hypothetical protein